MMTLDEFNTLPKATAYTQLEQCCVAETWVNRMLDSRPFSSGDDLIAKAAGIWYNDCTTADIKEAFTGHPKIGDVESLKKKFAHTKAWAGDEQAGVAGANDDMLRELAEANRKYEEKFGYIFIVSASGKTAGEMLALLKLRLYHNGEDEIMVAMNEQHKITVIRLARLVEGLAERADLRSHITTHALDTSRGTPAGGMLIALKNFRKDSWKPLSLGITNSDGRIPDVLPPGKKLRPGNYTMLFYTGQYFSDTGQQGFYPEVSIQFSVTDTSHYHIPLLINPFGYTTYRGS